MGNSKRTLLILLALLLLISPGCRGSRGRVEPTVRPTVAPTAKPVTEPTALQEEPTLEECRDWLASSQEAASLTPVPIACPTWSFFRDELFQRGGGVFPVGDERYYLVLFPDDWETVTDRKVIVSLHGTGGCAEWMLNHWYQTSSTAHSWALVALQYYDPESGQYDGDEVIYQNLQTVLDDLHTHCPITGSDIFYHGFSRGSAQSFPVAIHDWADRQAFSAFIADSGSAGLDYPTLRNAPDDALAGARFWMWCGENDVSTVDASRMTCQALEEDMRPYVENHGGEVDALIQEEGVAHGMFSGCPQEGSKDCSTRTAENLGPSLPLLFDYIEAFPENAPLSQQDAGSSSEMAVFLRQPWFQWPTERGAYLMAITTNETPLEVVVEYEGGSGTFQSVPTSPDVFAPGMEIPAEVYFHEVEIQWPDGVAQVDVSIANGGDFHATLDVPQQMRPLTMIVFGDTRGGDPTEDSGLQGENSAHEMVIDHMVQYDPAVVIHTGDMVPYGEKLTHWGNFLSIEEELLSTTFLFPVVGNHDLTADGDAANFGVLFHAEHTYLSEGSYWADLGLVGLVALDQYTLSDFTPQHQQWVKSALQRFSDKEWLIFTCHEPLLSAVSRDNWTDTPLVSILEESEVDLVVSGHAHLYEHFHDSGSGIHYIIAGGGGAPLSDSASLTDEAKLSREGVMAAGAFYHFIYLTVSDTSIEGTVIDASDGSVFETFTIDSEPTD